MNVLVVGSGAREHALAWKIGQSPELTELHAAPGNAGIAQFATCHDVELHDIDAITELACKLQVDLVIVGPEGPLVAGLSNRLKKFEIPCVGPSAASARLEGSKVFAKELMDRAQVPTARWEAFSDVQAALAAINRWRGPVVIKADGLTGGTGAFVCMTKVQAERALNNLLVESAFGVAGRRVVVEEFLQGTEATVAVLTDGEHLVTLPVIRGSKRREDGDSGVNTDGLGAYLPCSDLYDQQIEEAVESGIRPAIDDMRSRGLAYKGILYADVMFTRTGPKILEYNCRLGDPEAQALVRAMDEDLLVLLRDAAAGTLEDGTAVAVSGASVAVTLASSSYPERDADDKAIAIAGVEQAAEVEGVEVFVGSAKPGKKTGLVADGGRPLTITATGSSIAEARERAYEAIRCISCDGTRFRSDIAEAAVEAEALV